MEKTTNCFYHFFLASFQSVIASLYSVILRSEATKNLNRGQSTMKSYFVYILTNWNNKVMYIGITNNLERRMYEHKHKLVDGFTKRYNVNKLVYDSKQEQSILIPAINQPGYFSPHTDGVHSASSQTSKGR